MEKKKQKSEVVKRIYSINRDVISGKPWGCKQRYKCQKKYSPIILILEKIRIGERGGRGNYDPVHRKGSCEK